MGNDGVLPVDCGWTNLFLPPLPVIGHIYIGYGIYQTPMKELANIANIGSVGLPGGFLVPVKVPVYLGGPLYCNASRFFATMSHKFSHNSFSVRRAGG